MQEEQQSRKSKLERRIYSLTDLEKKNIMAAVSLDLRTLNVEQMYMPKDGGKYMLFLASVKKDARPDECKFWGAGASLTFSGKSELRVIHDRMKDNYRIDIMLSFIHIKSTNKQNALNKKQIYVSL